LRGVLSKQKECPGFCWAKPWTLILPANNVTLRDGGQLRIRFLARRHRLPNLLLRKTIPWRQWAPSLKSVEEATTIRHKILVAFERAERAITPGRSTPPWLTFVIVGAGATGMELAGALAEIASENPAPRFSGNQSAGRAHYFNGRWPAGS